MIGIMTSCADILAGRAPQDAPVTLQGWVRTRRDSKAGILVRPRVRRLAASIRCRSSRRRTLPNYASEVLHLTAGCAVEATGDDRAVAGQGPAVRDAGERDPGVGWVDDPDTYPIQPKPHTLEFLREVAHLRPRTNVFGA